MAAQQKRTGQSNRKSTGGSTGKNTGRNNSGRSSGGSSKSRASGSGRSGSRSSGSGRSSGSSRKNSRSGDRLTNILLGLLLVTIVVLAVMFALSKRGSDEEETPTPTAISGPQGNTPVPSPSGQGEADATSSPQPPASTAPTAGGEPQGSTPLPEPSGPEDAEPTQEPSLTPSAAPTPTPTATAAQPGPAVSLEESEKLIENAFWEAGENYRFELADDDMELGGDMYYRYKVYYRNQAEAYALLVDRVSGKLYYYENGERTEFDGNRREPEQDDKMTAEKAAELLADIPASSLMLPAPLGECKLSLDNWKTVVQGVDCYCLNVFYRDTLAGSIYFTETADTVYYLDEFGEFVRVR
ncbi:MAG: hypothetical protein K2N94_06385 [Lachnospiraceae bacterium]|nr:hypothetical protein [Lachnospiraceae bacterium]